MRPSSLGGGRILRRTLSVCLSVCPSVTLSIVTERHVAPLSELQWHTCTFRLAQRAAYRTAISVAQTCSNCILLQSTVARQRFHYSYSKSHDASDSFRGSQCGVMHHNVFFDQQCSLVLPLMSINSFRLYSFSCFLHKYDSPLCKTTLQSELYVVSSLCVFSLTRRRSVCNVLILCVKLLLLTARYWF